MNIEKLSQTPTQLDQQSKVKVDKWLDLDSEECKDKDPDMPFTKKCLRIGAEDKFLLVDSLGRIWGKGDGGRYYPFHFEYGKKIYGYRLATTAAN
jgi:hypothetical protein